MFLIIGIWGGERRVYSAFKFFLYTLLGSVLMLIAIIVIYLTSGIPEKETMNEAKIICEKLGIKYYFLNLPVGNIPINNYSTKLLLEKINLIKSQI